MAYIGKKPSDTFRGLAYKDTFTGDGSTVAFDLTREAPDGGDSDLEIFIDNVRQEGGVGKAYTLGADGSGDTKRVTFTAAPDSGADIYVLNPGRDSGVLGVGDNTISNTKLATTVINSQTGKATPIGADEVLLYDSAAGANKKLTLDNLFTNPQTELITAQGSLGELAADGDELLIYDTSAGAIKKVAKSNIATVIVYPTVTAVDPGTIDISTLTSITITGTNFVNGAKVEFQNSSTGALITANTVSHTNATTLVAGANLVSGSYFITVENPDGQAARSSSAILTVSAGPVWQTTAGSLGSSSATEAISFSAYATEADSGDLTYALVSGSLPGGASLSVDNNIAYITGTESGSSEETTYTFSLEVTDPESQVATREFSITITHGANNGGQFN